MIQSYAQYSHQLHMVWQRIFIRLGQNKRCTGAVSQYGPMTDLVSVDTPRERLRLSHTGAGSLPKRECGAAARVVVQS